MSPLFLHDLAAHMLIEAFKWGWRVRVVCGKHPMSLFLRAFGFVGFTAPWRTIYVLRGYEDSEVLLAHELAHVAQIRRDGRARFYIRATYHLFRYGHRNSPTEIEARALADDVLPALDSLSFVRHVKAYMRNPHHVARTGSVSESGSILRDGPPIVRREAGSRD